MFFLHTIDDKLIEFRALTWETENYFKESVDAFRKLNADRIDHEHSVHDGFDSGFDRTTFVFKDNTYHGFVRYSLS